VDNAATFLDLFSDVSGKTGVKISFSQVGTSALY
jgi:hypothetical protein